VRLPGRDVGGHFNSRELSWHKMLGVVVSATTYGEVISLFLS